jgi:hypothetical protein
MYRDVYVRAYEEEEIAKIDELREKGVNITELLLKAIMNCEIEPELELVS